MNGSRLYRITGVLFIIATLGFNGFFTLLSINFEYPDILRSPTSYVLTQYHAGGNALTLQWYGMVFVSMLLIPCVIFLHRLLRDQDLAYLSLGTVFGVLAGLMNTLGFIRWIFLVPHLAARYVDPATSQASKDAIEIVFEAFHLYAGFSIGEHLGYIFTGLWAMLAGFAMLRSSLFRPWLGWIGIVAGPLVIFGSLEGAGVAFAADVNVIGFAVWSLWLIATGIFLLLAKSQVSQPQQPTLARATTATK
jgi:hypothetical protein